MQCVSETMYGKYAKLNKHKMRKWDGPNEINLN